jgi:ATP synthase F1 gamma subunit
MFKSIVSSACRLPVNQLEPITQVRNATLRDLKNRMTTVNTIKKITTSMKTVASSKKGSSERARARIAPFAEASAGLLKDLPPPVPGTSKKIVVPIVADRGLCGSANSAVTRHIIKNFFNKDRANVEIYVLGDKGRTGLTSKFKPNLKYVMHKLDKRPLQFSDVSPFVTKFVNSEYDSITLVSNKFINAMTNQVKQVDLPSKTVLLKDINKAMNGIDIEGDEKEVVSNLYDFGLVSLILAMQVENQACEVNARLISMDNATRNANVMGNKIYIEMNRKRQADITAQLSEIVSGAAAVEGGEDW